MKINHIIIIIALVGIAMFPEGAYAIPMGRSIYHLEKTHGEKGITKARDHILRGEYEKAIDAALDILKKDPKNIAALRVMIFSAIAQRDFETAKKNLRDLQGTAPDSTELLLSFANLFHAQKDHGKAIIAYNNVLKREKDNTAARFALGNIYEDLNNPPLATKRYKEILEYDPEHRGALKRLCFIYLDLKGYEYAIKTAQKAVWPYWIIGESFIRKGDLVKGKEYIKKGW